MIKMSDLGFKIEAFPIKSKGPGDHRDGLSVDLNEDWLLKINLHFQVAIMYGSIIISSRSCKTTHFSSLITDARIFVFVANVELGSSGVCLEWMLDGHHRHRLFTSQSKCGKNRTSKVKTKKHVGNH
jgi:hypothetical protein